VRAKLGIAGAATGVALFLASLPGTAIAAPTSDPCRVLRRPEIRKVLGAVSKGFPDPLGGCNYELHGGISAAGGGIFTVTLFQGPTVSDVFQQNGAGQTALHGLGDGAFYRPQSGVNVLSGDSYLIIDAVYSSNAPSAAKLRAKLVKLAKVALRRL
jgi:hypothetical protein